jgi:hypothetical protein
MFLESSNFRRKNPMSTVEKTPEKAAEPVKMTKSYEGYDDNLILIKRDVEVVYTPVSDQTTAVEALNKLGSWIEAANFAIRKNALKEARQKAGVDGSINRAVLMEFIKPYRELPQFAGLISVADKRQATAEEWNKQTAAILEQIKNVSFIMSAIKEKSAIANAEEE